MDEGASLSAGTFMGGATLGARSGMLDIGFCLPSARAAGVDDEI